jgi:tripartite-type tricarboxylate transporter receptor subunit TctC
LFFSPVEKREAYQQLAGIVMSGRALQLEPRDDACEDAWAASTLMKPVHYLLTLAYALAAVAHARAEYPDKPLRLVVPFPPGGGTEPLARMWSQKISEVFGHQVIVDNRPGAGTTIGAEIVAKSPPDGYTLLLGSIANAISAVLYAKLNYDLARDFAPITMLATTPGVLVVHPTLPVKSVRELIALAKARPGQLAYASSGSGTPNHLAAELFSYMTGVKWIHVPYKGGGPSVVALLSGEAPLSFASMPSAIQHIRAGKLRALGVTTAERSQALPNVPTIAEAGVPGYAAETWYGVSAPARTPKEIVARLNAETIKAFGAAEVKERLDTLGYLVRVNAPDEYAAFTRTEIEKWARVVKAADMRAD